MQKSWIQSLASSIKKLSVIKAPPGTLDGQNRKAVAGGAYSAPLIFVDAELLPSSPAAVKWLSKRKFTSGALPADSGAKALCLVSHQGVLGCPACFLQVPWSFLENWGRTWSLGAADEQLVALSRRAAGAGRKHRRILAKLAPWTILSILQAVYWLGFLAARTQEEFALNGLQIKCLLMYASPGRAAVCRKSSLMSCVWMPRLSLCSGKKFF